MSFTLTGFWTERIASMGSACASPTLPPSVSHRRKSWPFALGMGADVCGHVAVWTPSWPQQIYPRVGDTLPPR